MNQNNVSKQQINIPHIKCFIKPTTDFKKIFKNINQFCIQNKLSSINSSQYIFTHSEQKKFKSHLLDPKTPHNQQFKLDKQSFTKSHNSNQDCFLPSKMFHYKLPTKNFPVNQSQMNILHQKPGQSMYKLDHKKKYTPTSIKIKYITQSIRPDTLRINSGNNLLQKKKLLELFKFHTSHHSELRPSQKSQKPQSIKLKHSKIQQILQKKMQQQIQQLQLSETNLISHSIHLQKTPLKKKIISYPQKNHKQYKFWFGPGNNHQLLKKILQQTRGSNWIETTQYDTLFNLKWQQYTQKSIYQHINFHRYKQLINHLQSHQYISNKIGLIQTLKYYYLKVGQNLQFFQYIPITFIFNQQNMLKFEQQIKKFIFYFCQNHYDKSKSQKMQRYMVDIIKDLFHASKKLPSLSFNKTAYKKLNLPQLNPCFLNNNNEYLWLIKPSQLNRGRGIKMFNTLEQMCQIIKNNFNGESFIIQKYIEKPLLINGRKFDIRVWVLVSLQGIGYIFKEGYIRTSCQSFSLTQSQKNNKYVHLTNNAIQKTSNKYGLYQQGNQLSFADFDALMSRQEGYFKKQYFHQIKKICKIIIDIGIKKMVQVNKNVRYNPHSQFIKQTYRIKTQSSNLLNDKKYVYSPSDQYQSHPYHLKNSQQQNKSIKGTFQLFGFDFMVSSNNKIWLIEVNTNPCLQTSSKLLQQLIPRMIDDAFKIVIDPFFQCKSKKGLYPVKNYKNQENMWVPLKQSYINGQIL